MFENGRKYNYDACQIMYMSFDYKKEKLMMS
jgi:hypothetical protein